MCAPTDQSTKITVVWFNIVDYAYDECPSPLTIKGHSFDNCDPMITMGALWLGFGCLSFVLGVIGTFMPMCSAMCDSKPAKKIGSWALFIAGVCAIVAACSLAVGGKKNFCIVHGGMSYSPIMVIIAAILFQVAGILVGCYKPRR